MREGYNTCSGRRDASVLPAMRAISVCCSTVGPVTLITVVETSPPHPLTDEASRVHMLKCLHTSRLDLRKEGAQFLALYNVCDDMACDFRVSAISDDYRCAPLKSP